MNHWSFVAAAYAFTIVAVAALLVRSWLAMRNAEAAVEELKRAQ